MHFTINNQSFEIKSPFGANGIKHLFEGSLYRGQFVFTDRWELRLQDPGLLSEDEIQALEEKVNASSAIL